MSARGRGRVPVAEGGPERQNEHEWLWLSDDEARAVSTATACRRTLPLQRCAHCAIVVRSGTYYLLPGESVFRGITPRPPCIPREQRGQKGAA